MKQENKEEILKKTSISYIIEPDDRLKSKPSDGHNFRINSSTYSEKKSNGSFQACELSSFDEDLENGVNV